MENASKALTMAAGVIIAVIVISLGIYIFNIFSQYSKEQTEELYSNQVMEFNAQFTKYETMEDITIYDIISLANYAHNYNQSLDNAEDRTELGISVKLGITAFENMTDEEKKSYINTYMQSEPIPKYKVQDIQYSQVTGKVKSITFKQQ